MFLLGLNHSFEVFGSEAEPGKNPETTRTLSWASLPAVHVSESGFHPRILAALTSHVARIVCPGTLIGSDEYFPFFRALYFLDDRVRELDPGNAFASPTPRCYSIENFRSCVVCFRIQTPPFEARVLVRSPRGRLGR